MKKFKFKFKFKSLTMRIWTTFTIIILIIISSISFFYLVAFKSMNEKAITNDLKVSHDILLKTNNFTQPNRSDEFGNLKGSDYFIYNVDKYNIATIINVNKGSRLPPNTTSNHNSPFKANYNNVKIWMSTFITPGTLYEKQYKGTYNNMKFIFIISSVNYGSSGKSYLITYIPEMLDNSMFLHGPLGGNHLYSNWFSNL